MMNSHGPSATGSAAVDASELISAYAVRFHALFDEPHYVASPAGAWLLLALAAIAAPEHLRAELEKALGTDIPTASRLAAAMLASPPPAVAAASAVWSDPEVCTAIKTFLAMLPESTETGPLPSQAAADAWAAASTAGLIESFPVQLGPETVLVLATALASKITWERSFGLVDAEALGAGEWAAEISSALRAPSEHAQELFEDPDVGLIAAHGAEGNGLLVVSAIAASSASPSSVLAAAHRVARSWAQGQPPNAAMTPVSLFDLPLGKGPAWTISEHEARVSAHDGRESLIETTLPAWRATSDLDLATPGLGLDLAGAGLITQLPPNIDGYEFEARQSAMAAYGRDGFEAAAVSAVSLMRSASRPPRTIGVRRVARVAFAHPYAVVAVVPARRWDPSSRQIVSGPWASVPVFSAWVGTPSDAE